MQTITLEWCHLDQEGVTCDRCTDTGAELRAVTQDLNAECAPCGVSVRLLETKLDAGQMAQSNLILLNGQALEDILPQTQAGQSECPSCGELTGQDESCRTIVRFGKVYETVPQQLIRQAVCRIAQCC